MNKIKTALNVFLLVISTSWAAEAYLVPGRPGRGEQPAPYPGERPGHGGGGLTPGRPHNPPYSPPHNPPYNPPHNPPYSPPHSPPYNPPYSPPSAPDYGSELKRVYIARSVQNETLPLRHLAGIGREYRGYEVVSVRANTRPNSSRQTTVQLISDGRVVATQYNPGYQIVLYPQSHLVLDQNSNTLQLAITGGTYIDDIEIELRRGDDYNPPAPGYGQNIELNIYRSVSGNDRIDLTQHIDMRRYQGRVIEQIMVTANARYNTGFISLLINSFNLGQVQINGSYSQVATYRLNQSMIIGQGADSIVLYTQGNMTIEHVTIVLR